MPEIFRETARDAAGFARCGRLELPHGSVATPVFMPVGTAATVKAIDADSLRAIGFEIILANTYHLYLRPGVEVVERGGGLHKWMGWDRNVLTDSGGFQVFSLAPFRKITAEGAKFRSHIDGSEHLLTPESVVRIQAALGSDIQMQLDVCTKWRTEYRDAERALTITTGWLDRAIAEWRIGCPGYSGQLFAIVQGNFYKDLRDRSVAAVLERDLPGIAIGGLSVGEPFEVFAEFLGHTARLLPAAKPRYVMGIGTPDFILEAIDQGIDMFDCVFPTRTARNGLAFTRRGPLTIKKERNEFDYGPLDPVCGCKVCRTYSRSYLRHLFRNGEILAAMLLTYHNLHFLHAMVVEARAAIAGGRFADFKRAFLSEYREGA